MNTRLLSRRVLPGAIFAGLASLTLAKPALAHHPFGGTAPDNIFEGILSGIGHPVIGFDHLAFVVAVGLLAAVVSGGWRIPAVFVVATLVGTGLHLAELNLPIIETVIAISVLLFGGLAVMRDRLNPMVVMLLAALAGVFHGYAYGEAVVGAEPTPLVAYLVGFAAVQSAIAYLAYLISKRAIEQSQSAGLVSVRHAGFMVLGVGAAFVGGLLV
ncbi:HupE/UreJ family protein [cf. Phormidesmis sp. LEGE 11477]|uniref:HupE/UreJ family protein n=1 Tax=cf. Phormidesmis sp. LEGE 11477 TaxID=1828680 RepID=UPI00187EF330|nr:HupE/UreJ family protein [cf. Phormidesmis sp. LEGE 11477]MBE9064588.1 HupE/UreJ family protein [cf. Phormidesmis sp. LEGE 11477]